MVSGAELAATKAEAVTPASSRRIDPIGPIFRFAVPEGSESGAAAEIERIPGVRFAEPDYLLESAATPDDPELSRQWAIENNAQTVNGMQGVAGADENVIPAWDVTTGSSDTVVAVVDTGVDYDHPDLAPNIWNNPEGLGGCPVGSHGINTVGTDPPTCDPIDDDVQFGGHGTHVAGILGARGNNDIGIAGVDWSITMLPVKFVDSQGQGRTSDLLEGLQWLLGVKQAGVDLRIVNDSQTFVGTPFSQAAADMIDLLGANDILFVTAAGNSGADNDDPAVRRYPCGYGRPNEICVTATNNRDQLPGFANYGDETVDLGAPGSNIYSTLRDDSPVDPGPNYGFISGGSMAAPQVSGAAALILSTGYRSATELKSMILDNVDPLPSLAGKVRTGGRLDVCSAIPACNPDDDGDGVADVDDACPSLAGGGTASGCPDAAGSVRLRYARKRERFKGRLRYRTAAACASRRPVTLWKQRRGRDAKLTTITSRPDGSFRIAVQAGRGRYYAKLLGSIVPDIAACAPARSPLIRVRGGSRVRSGPRSHP